SARPAQPASIPTYPDKSSSDRYFMFDPRVKNRRITRATMMELSDGDDPKDEEFAPAESPRIAICGHFGAGKIPRFQLQSRFRLLYLDALNHHESFGASGTWARPLGSAITSVSVAPN